MLNHVLELPGPLLPGFVIQCQLIAPNFLLQGPLLSLLVVLNHVLALPGPLLPGLVAQCLLSAPNFSLQGPLLSLLFVLNHVLTLPGPLLPGLVAQCQLIAPNSSLRDLHAFVLEQQPSFDSFFYGEMRIHYLIVCYGMLHSCSPPLIPCSYVGENEDSLFNCLNCLLWYALSTLITASSGPVVERGVT